MNPVSKVLQAKGTVFVQLTVLVQCVQASGYIGLA